MKFKDIGSHSGLNGLHTLQLEPIWALDRYNFNSMAQVWSWVKSFVYPVGPGNQPQGINNTVNIFKQ